MKKYLNSNYFSTLVFDLDGTLYSRNIYHKDYYNFTLFSVMDLFNKSEIEAKEILKKGNITPDLKEPQGSVSSLMSKLGMPIKKWNKYRDLKFDVTSLIQSNKKLVADIEKLSKRFQVVLLTNNTQYSTNRILKKLGFISFKAFHLIITSDFGLELKPKNEPFYYIKDKLNVEFKNMISIGDRYLVDIYPVLKLEGSGIQISKPSDISIIASKLTNSNWIK